MPASPDYERYYRSRVTDLSPQGKEWRGPCPIHGGDGENLTIDFDKGTWYCHSGCKAGGGPYEFEMKWRPGSFREVKPEVDEILGCAAPKMNIQASGMTVMQGGVPPKPKPADKITDVYDYTDADGKLHFQVVRLDPKGFRQRRPHPHDPQKFVYSLVAGYMVRSSRAWKRCDVDTMGAVYFPEIPHLLYRMPDLVKAETVVIVEGEKDVETASKLGLVATCNAGGAGKFNQNHAAILRGKTVWIIADKDQPGRDHAKRCADLLRAIDCPVFIAEAPDPYKDLSEWEAGEAVFKADIEALFRGAEPVSQTAPLDNAPDFPMSMEDMLERYVILMNSDGIWDRRFCEMVNHKQLKQSTADFYTDWVKHPLRLRRSRKDLVFAPKGCQPHQINIFTGLHMVPDISRPHDRIVGLISHLCDYDAEMVDWVTKWLAYPLQHIGAKMHSAVVVHGEQGTGKNLLFETVMSIYDPYAVQIGQHQIESQYGDWMSGKLFCVADEVVSRRDRIHSKNWLKRLVTSSTVRIEEKFQSSRDESNHMNMVFLSNEDMPLVLEREDRRHAILECNHVKPREYYDAIVEQINVGGARGLMAYLLAYPLGDFNVATKPPKNEAKKDLIGLGADTVDTFLDEWEAGILPVTFGSAVAGDLYQAYSIWCNVNGERFPRNSTAFGVRAAKRWNGLRMMIGGRQVRVVAPDGFGRNDEIRNFAEDVVRWREEARKLALR